MRRRIRQHGEAVAVSLGALPIEVAGTSMEALRLDSRDFHEPLLKWLIGLGIIRRSDPRRGGRAYMQRLQVNYLRFNHLNLGRSDAGYAELLEAAAASIGFQSGYHALNDRILDTIAARVPHLRDACDAQRGEEYLIEPEDIFRPYMGSAAEELLPLRLHGSAYTKSRSVIELARALRSVPVMTEGELSTFSQSYHEGTLQKEFPDLFRQLTSLGLAAVVTQYLRDRALGLDLRNVDADRYRLSASADAERAVLKAISERYPALREECERRMRNLAS